VRDFFKVELHLSQDYVESLLIKNVHRLPKNPENTYMSTAPKAIIVSLVCYSDRNVILAAQKNLDNSKRMTVRTDLPSDLKAQRSQISRQTSIKEK